MKKPSINKRLYALKVDAIKRQKTLFDKKVQRNEDLAILIKQREKLEKTEYSDSESRFRAIKTIRNINRLIEQLL